MVDGTPERPLGSPEVSGEETENCGFSRVQWEDSLKGYLGERGLCFRYRGVPELRGAWGGIEGGGTGGEGDKSVYPKGTSRGVVRVESRKRVRQRRWTTTRGYEEGWRKSRKSHFVDQVELSRWGGGQKEVLCNTRLRSESNKQEREYLILRWTCSHP